MEVVTGAGPLLLAGAGPQVQAARSCYSFPSVSRRSTCTRGYLFEECPIRDLGCGNSKRLGNELSGLRFCQRFRLISATTLFWLTGSAFRGDHSSTQCQPHCRPGNSQKRNKHISSHPLETRRSDSNRFFAQVHNFLLCGGYNRSWPLLLAGARPQVQTAGSCYDFTSPDVRAVIFLRSLRLET